MPVGTDVTYTCPLEPRPIRWECGPWSEGGAASRTLSRDPESELSHELEVTVPVFVERAPRRVQYVEDHRSLPPTWPGQQVNTGDPSGGLTALVVPVNLSKELFLGQARRFPDVADHLLIV